MSSRWLIGAICLGLIALTWLIFGQTLRYEFVNYDDGIYVYENPIVRNGLTLEGINWALTHRHGGNWHPLATFSHLLDCQLFGLKSGGHHFVNVLLHAIGAVLLFLVLRASTGSLWRSLFVAAVFAIHPLRAESVAWIAERKDVLSGVFFMLALGAYVHYARNSSAGRYVTMSILFVFGLMAKPMLVTLPVIFLLWDYWPLRRFDNPSTSRQLFLEKIPLLAISFVLGVATVVAHNRSIATTAQFPLSWRISNALVSCVTYIRQMFWPAELAVFYPHPENRLALWQIISAAILIIVVSALAIRFRKRYPYVLTGWFWYLIMLLPVIGLVQVGSQGHADRYTYLPQIGLYLLLTWLVADSLRSLRYDRQTLSAAAAIIIIVLSFVAWKQTSYWHDSETLWRHAVAVTPRNDVAHASLAEVLLMHGNASEAASEAQAALEIQPNNPEAHNNLGLALIQTGDVNSAVNHWREGLRIQPKNLNGQCNVAWVMATCPVDSVRDGARAVGLMQNVLRQSGFRSAILLRTLAAAYAESGRFGDAIVTAQEALQLARANRNFGLAADLEANITSYKMNIPVRDPSLATVRP
jgi:tetratricopeptide (TPR) repeat protein